LSREGKVNWQETAGEQTFLAAVAKYVVTIRESNWNGSTEYDLEVSDQSGKTLENASVSSGPLFADLSELHTLARRHALKVDEALTDLLSSLAEIH
jgi:hypothetical protein